MSVHTPTPLPVLIAFGETAAREDSWGRLKELAAVGTKLATRAGLKKDDYLFLSFEIGGEAFKAMPAKVSYAESEEGFTLAELRFTDEVEKRRLAKALLDILSRAF